MITHEILAYDDLFIIYFDGIYKRYRYAYWGMGGDGIIPKMMKKADKAPSPDLVVSPVDLDLIELLCDDLKVEKNNYREIRVITKVWKLVG